MLQKLDEERRRRWNEAVQSIDFTHSSRRAWSIHNNLTGHSTHPPRQCSISANTIASQLTRNRKYETKDRETAGLVREETSQLWKIPTPNGSSLTREFSPAEFATAFQKLKPAKAPGPDQICPELILHAGPIIKFWLCKFLSPVCASLELQKFGDVLWWLLFLSRTNPWTMLKATAQSLCFAPPARSSRGSFTPASSLSSIPCSHVSKQASTLGRFDDPKNRGLFLGYKEGWCCLCGPQCSL